MTRPSRIIIAGGPRTGKTTLAATYPGLVLHTDDLIGQLDWSAASGVAAGWFDVPGPWVIEGVATVRALRKWLAAHASGQPADLVLWLGTPLVARTPGQVTMARGCETVWAEVLPLLRARGVAVERR